MPTLSTTEAGFTRRQLSSKAVVLRQAGDGVYTIDGAKGNLPSNNQVLMDMGRCLERLFTMHPVDFSENLLKPGGTLMPDEYKYTQVGPFLLRSQIDVRHSIHEDAFYDIKTRAIRDIRLDVTHYEKYQKFKIQNLKNHRLSFETEFMDMVRASFPKNSLQMRIGGMKGLFVAYHNTADILGFETLTRDEVDCYTYGSPFAAEFFYKAALRMAEMMLDDLLRKLPPTRAIRIVVKPLLGGRLIYAAAPLKEEEGFPEYSISWGGTPEHVYSGTLNTDIIVNNTRVRGPFYPLPEDKLEVYAGITPMEDEQIARTRYRQLMLETDL
eukprot:CAMPEP_0177643798 /NCGR_PEP_ID=MMETSP0447-20121125/8340_1 /TAXON_ID=0 /ORGANISM="Stygamoeba regulata, Strain BSH-02190019" /LENGTH=324 /DNA_ID=CAMNT_0019146103 /DNA_START=216 /DNA_END=1187 /DNA_ORIENTATION=-